MYQDSYTVNYDKRKPSQADNLFTERWSPRSFKKVQLDSKVIETLGEAARWSPSVFNIQPWRIVFAENGSEKFEAFLGLLMELNQSWAKNVSLLGFFVAKLQQDDGKSVGVTAAFDTGFAWAALTFQARKLGLYTHGMAGLNYEDAYTRLDIDKSKYAILAAFAVGVLDQKETLNERMQEMESPSGDRKPLQEVFSSDLQIVK